MKKRVVILFVVLTMAVSLVACAGEENRTSDEVTNQEVADDVTEGDITESETEGDAESGESTVTGIDTVSILNDVWATYEENDKFYAMGGDMNHPVDNAPGLYSLEDPEAIGATLLVSSDALGMVDEAASMLHGMNVNIFTGAAFHLTDASDAQAFSDVMKNNILNNQWMCGSPDQYVIYSVNDEYVVVAFGSVDVMNVFKEKFTAVHGEYTETLAEGNIAQ